EHRLAMFGGAVETTLGTTVIHVALLKLLRPPCQGTAVLCFAPFWGVEPTAATLPEVKRPSPQGLARSERDAEPSRGTFYRAAWRGKKTLSNALRTASPVR